MKIFMPILGILVSFTTVNAAKSYPLVQSSLISLADQSVTVIWLLDSGRTNEIHAFKTTLNCGAKNLSSNVEVAAPNSNVVVKDSKLSSLVKSEKIIVFDEVAQTLNFGTGETYFCDNRTLKIDFKKNNYMSKADQKLLGGMWDAAHPAYEIGRFNLISKPVSVSKSGNSRCGFIFSLFSDVENKKLRDIKSQINVLNNCLTGYYFNSQANDFYRFKATAADVAVLGNGAPLKMENILPDDVLLFYWTTNINKNDGWFKTVVDTQKDQYWTVPAIKPSGVSIGK